MSLFKTFEGSEEELNNIPLKNGYAYFVPQTGKMFIDIANQNEYDADTWGSLEKFVKAKRIPISAEAAKGMIIRENGEDVVVDSSLLSSSVAVVTIAVADWNNTTTVTKNITDVAITPGRFEIPPIITCTNNSADYNLLTKAQVTFSTKNANGEYQKNAKIALTASSVPTLPITLQIVNIK